jgi:phosphatidylserine/phosphatidylglycerophosphate/cardiolipin synthase-like enzyme
VSNRALVATITVVAVVLLCASCFVVALLLARVMRDDDQPAVTHVPLPPRATTTVPPAVSGDWYEVYFTTPIYPDSPRNHRGGLDERLVELMDAASESIDVAVYDFDLGNVAEAMARASRRGVTVRMVTDTDTVESDDPDIQDALQTVRRGDITIVDDERSAIMHHKFTVVDGRWVATGSWNYTDGDTYRLNNNLVVIDSDDLAQNYTAVFQRMFDDGEFGPGSADDLPDPTLSIGDARVENCFSPSQGCSRLVEDTVAQAEESIHFMAFSFTDTEIGNAMIERAKAGVDLTGVFESTGSQTRFSEYGVMQQAGLEVYTDGNPYAMHHKVIIVDERTVIFGSYNFTSNADDSNNENLVIVDDPQLAAAFEAEFQRVLDLARNPIQT